MSAGKAIVHLERMIRMKEERLAAYSGANDHFLRADIAALRFALDCANTQWANELLERRPVAAL